MAFNQTHIDLLDEAISTGELEVNFGDRKVRYRSIEELKKAKRHIQNELSGSATSSSTIRKFQTVVSKL